ncbi:MAG: DUF2064 domain-containing protein [Acidimicrobiia bacterium]
MSPPRTVLVLAKEPVAGRVKTRLCPPFTLHEAALLAAAALDDTLSAVQHTRCDRRVLVLDGEPPARLDPSFEVRPQAQGALDRRLSAAFANVDGPTVLVGMDTPQVTPELIDDALAHLDACNDAVIGRSVDGGFWIVGLTRPTRRAFLGVPMSTPTTGAVQHARLVELGLHTATLPLLRDVDEYDDAVAVARGAPATRFAAAFRQLDSKFTRVLVS